MNSINNGRKALFASVALAACLGFTINAQAQTCVISNWDGTPVGLADGNAGTQDSFANDNRRYGGPCGLRVPVDGSPHYVTDTSPANETTYIARFYAFLENTGADPVQIFGADDGAEDQIQVWYNFPNANELTLRVFDNGGTPTDLTETVSTGWHSVEFVWEADASPSIAYSVDGNTDLTTSALDTSGIVIANAHLGNVDGAATGGGEIDFDDFDSRRIERPGRLCRGLTDSVRSALDFTDAQAAFTEFSTNGNTPAGGQPDYNEDGVVDFTDAQAIFNRFATGNEDCSLNL